MRLYSVCKQARVGTGAYEYKFPALLHTALTNEHVRLVPSTMEVLRIMMDPAETKERDALG